MTRPVPKVGDVVEVDSNPDPELNAPHPSDWVPMIVTRVRGGRVVCVKAPPGTRFGLMALDALGCREEPQTWWRWPRWHLSTVLLAMASDVTLPRDRRVEACDRATVILETPMLSFDLAWQAYPLGMAEAAGLPCRALASDPREVHDALVAYAEAHGIERDAP
jgi:hypothetical protein